MGLVAVFTYPKYALTLIAALMTGSTISILWRLFIYACEVPEKYNKYTNQECLAFDFNEYLKLGKVKKIPGTMSNLYFIQP